MKPGSRSVKYIGNETGSQFDGIIAKIGSNGFPDFFSMHACEARGKSLRSNSMSYLLQGSGNNGGINAFGVI